MRKLLGLLLFLVALLARCPSAGAQSVVQTGMDVTDLACTVDVSPAIIRGTDGAVCFCDAAKAPDAYTCVVGGGGGGGGAPTAGPYVTKVTDAGLSNEFALGSLATGILKNTTTTGVPTIAAAGTDFQAPDTDLDDLADGTLSGSKIGTGISGSNVSTGTVADARIDAALARDSELPAGANPSATVGLAATNGSAATFLRSDGAPAMSQAIAPLWTDDHGWAVGKGLKFTPAATFPGGQAGGSCTPAPPWRQLITEPTDTGGDFAGSCAGNDTELMACRGYNLSPSSCNARENSADYQLIFKEVFGWTADASPDDRRAEYFWQVITPGGTTWLPFLWNIVNLDAETPSLDYTIRSSTTQVALQFNSTTVAVMGAVVGKGDLEVNGGPGGGDAYLRDDLKFEGTTSDTNQTTLSAKDPTGTNSIILPNSTGRVPLLPETSNAGIWYGGGTTADTAFDTGTEICTSQDRGCLDAYLIDNPLAADSCSTVFAAATCSAGGTPWTCCSGSGTWTCIGFQALCRRNTGS